MLQLKVSYL